MLRSDLCDNSDVYIFVKGTIDLLATAAKCTGILWNYYRDNIDDVDDNASDRNSFKYRTKLVGKHQNSLEMKKMQIDHQCHL